MTVVLMLSLLLLAAKCCMALHPNIPVDTGNASLYMVYQITIKANLPVRNPFTDLEVNVSFTDPHSRYYNVQAFYNGKQTFAARIACNLVGSWRWTSNSNAIPYSDQQGSFYCHNSTAPNIHGGLVIDPNNSHNFIYEDGTRYWMMAYECDWFYALELEDDSTPTTQDAFLDTLAYGGYNQILMNVYANYSSWAKNVSRPPRVGPTANTPWLGDDQSRLNLKYWQHLDDTIARMQARGIICHLFITVWNKNVNWPERLSANDDLFWRTVISRYQAFSNIIWDMSKEGWRVEDSYWNNRVPLVHQWDAHNRPITMHSQWHKHQSLKMEYFHLISDQQHGSYHEHIQNVYATYNMPVANVEFLYEMGPIFTYGQESQADDMRPVLWSILMGGGYAAWYYSPTAWDVIMPDQVPPGYSQCRRAMDFFTKRTSYWLLEPSDNITSHGYALAYSGQEYVIYVNNTDKFSVTIEATTGLKATWMDPLSGQLMPDKADKSYSSGTYEFDPGSSLVTSRDAVLHLHR